MTVYPAHWPRHAGQPACGEGYCARCELEQDWAERHEDCHCLDHTWSAVDVGTPAAPDLQWVCCECLLVQGAAFTGDSS